MLRAKHMAERNMQDTLQIGTGTGGRASFGNAPGATTWAYDDTNPVRCFVDSAKSGEVKDGTEVTITDAEIRVPLGSSITAKSRVKVTHRFRETLDTPEIYAVIGAPKNGRSSMVLNCKRVTGESRL